MPRFARPFLPLALVAAAGLGGCGEGEADRAREELDRQSQELRDKVGTDKLRDGRQQLEEQIDRGRQTLDETSDELKRRAEEARDGIPDIDPR